MPFMVCDQTIQCSCSISPELMGQGIKLLESVLILFPQEQIDILWIWFKKGLHGVVSSWDISSNYFSRTPDLDSRNPKPIRVLLIFIEVVVLQLVEPMTIPVPWFDQHTPFLFPWEVVLRRFRTLGETFWWIRWSKHQRWFIGLCSELR